MAKKNSDQEFIDPLENIDPVMEQAFSTHPAASDPVPAPASESSPREDAPTVSDIQFPELPQQPGTEKIQDDVFSSIPVNVSVRLGSAQISLREVHELSEGSIIELERLVGEPLDLVINDQVIARGEVVAIDNHYGLRITEIISKPQ